MKPKIIAAENVLYSLGEALITTDISGKITWINPAAENLTRFQADDLEGTPLESILQFDGFSTAEKNDNLLELVLRNGKIALHEVGAMLVTKGKKTIPVNGTASPVIDHEGKVQGVVLMFRTVAGKVEAEPKRTVNEPDYRNIFAGIGQGFCIIEKVKTTGNQPVDFRYIMANQAFEKHTGVQNVVGKTIREFVPEAEQNVMDILNQVILTRKHQEFETFISTLNFWLKAEVIPTENPDQIAVLFTNISNQKQADTILLDSETLLKQIINSDQDAVFAIGLNYNFLMCNQRYEQVLKASGSPPFRVGETMLPQHYPPEVLNYWQTAYDRALQGEDFKLETTWPDVDGNTNIFENYFSPLRDATGTITGALVVARDVTQRKNAEKNLQESESRFSRLFRSNPVPVGITTASGFRIVDVNDAWTRLTGYSREEAIGHTSAELGLSKPETLQKVGGLVQALGEIRNVEIPIITRSGEERMVLITSGQIEIDGEAYFLNNLLDITEQERTIQKLHLSEERARAMLDAIPDMVFRMERKGTFLDYKADAKDLYEQTVDLIGRNNREVSPPEFADLVERKIEDTLTSRKIQTFEYQLPIPGKGVLDFEARMAPSGTDQVIAIVRNITERKLTEEKLRIEKEKLDKIAASVPGLLCSFHQNPDGLASMPYASPAAKDIYGLEPEDIAGDFTPVFSRILPEDVEHVISTINESAKTMGVWKDEFRYNHPTKGVIWIEGTSTPVMESDGSITWHGFIADITSRKMAEESLHLQSAALNAAANEKFITDTAGKILWVNQAWSMVSGYSPEEAIGKSTRILQSGKQDKAFYKQMWDQIMAGNIWHNEMVNKRKDGTLFYEDLTISPVRNSQGQITHFVGIKQDITERKKEEKQRIRLAERLDLATRSAQIGIWDWDIQQNELIWDDQMYALYGLKPGAFSGAYEAWLQGVHPDDRDLSNDVSNRALRGETTYDTEFRVLWPDGSVHWIKADGQVFRDEQGTPLRMVGVNYDISEQKQAVVKLRESEEKYRGLLESMDSVVATINGDGEFLYMNDIAARWLGGTTEQMTGKTMYQLFPEEVASRQLQNIRQVISENKSMVEEAVSYLRGKPHWFRNSLQPIRDEHGHVTHVLLNSTDIHELKTAQHELAELNQTLEERIRQATSQIQDLYDNAPSGYHSLDANGKFIMINQTELNWLGYSKEEIIGQPFIKFVTAESLITFQNNFPVFLKQGWINDLEFMLVRKDGSTFPVLVSATAIRDEAGKLVMSRSTVTDITERKQAEQKLQIRESYLSAIIENQPGLIWLKDKVGRFLAVNSAFAHSCGKEKPEMLQGLNDLDIYPADLAQRYRYDDAEIMREGKPRIVEEPVMDKGERRWFETFKTPVYDQQGAVIGTTGFSRNITDRKQSEEALQMAYSELERAIRVKDEFLASMSHELRTPLNAILGLSEILIGQYGGPLNERQLRSMITIEKSGRHLLELITDILDLSKLEAKQMTLDQSFVAVSDICEASLLFIKELAQKKNIRLRSTLDPEVILIWADGRRLRQMLINLLSNAVKFTPEQGTIELKVSGNPLQKTASFSISDTGIGISAENIGRLFQPFVQLESKLNRQNQGTGLGLALVRRMAELHGGNIKVESEVGKGSIFTITLPWTDANQPQTAKSQKLEEKKNFTEVFKVEDNAPLILVAEDNEANLDVITAFLEFTGCRFEVALNGREALEKIQHERPDLILMDIQMPVMDGLEAIHRLRSNPDPEIAKIPVIALTALAMLGDRERFIEAGADEYLSKPVDLTKLAALIKKFNAKV